MSNQICIIVRSSADEDFGISPSQKGHVSRTGEREKVERFEIRTREGNNAKTTFIRLTFGFSRESLTFRTVVRRGDKRMEARGR